ncbi:hypothetical protein AB0G04_12535 [Actinoplanes sp. NPDC023801]|uniref:hypothetical protein n=1 Tax=Actinoplanes sp. NPDC023801 TaxID=3154595 RepID=UPI0033E71829
MGVERLTDPFQRPAETDLGSDGCGVGADQVDLGVELAIPPTTDDLGLRPWQGTGDRGLFQRGADQGFDRAAAPTCPAVGEQGVAGVGSAAPSQVVDVAKDGEVEAEVGVGDSVAGRFAAAGRQWPVGRQDLFVLG